MSNAPSPALNISNIITYTIKINGKSINDLAMATSLNITHQINKISFADLTVGTNTGEAATYNFSIGNTIEIYSGYQGADEKKVFSGIIFTQSMKTQSPLVFMWELKCKHVAMKMTGNKKKMLYFNKTDSDIFSKILTNPDYTQTDKNITSTNSVNEYLPQNNISDWDFLLSRSEMWGYLIYLDKDSIFIGKPNLKADPVLTISAGDSMIDFTAKKNGSNQFTSIKANTLNKTREIITFTSTEPDFASGRNIGKSMATALNAGSIIKDAVVPMQESDLKEWANGKLLRMRLSAFQGSVKFVGNAIVKTGDWIKLNGIGDEYSIEAFVSEVNHKIAKGSWQTSLKLGLEDAPINEKVNFASAGADGQMPAAQGLFSAIVKAIEGDPNAACRIKIIDTLQTDDIGVWAKMCHSYATESAGFFFMPEVGDEVVISYLNGDPRYPVILGSLYNNKNVAPIDKVKDTNFIKMISTKNKLKLTFDDEKKTVTIETPGDNKIVMSDDAKSIEITDQHSNAIKLTSSGIEFNSAKDITIKAQGAVNINSGTGKIAIEASAGDVTLAGLNINHTAKMAFKAEGNLTAELSSSAQAVLKGAIVMIN